MEIIQSIEEIAIHSEICGCDYAECSCDTDTLLPEDADD